MPGTRPGMTSFVRTPHSIGCILSQTLRTMRSKHHAGIAFSAVAAEA
jgi:hypothetical protein